MPATAPPPPGRSAPAVPRTLFGRDDALALLDGALVPGCVTALVGPPGVGKSTLVAAAAAGRGGTVWVDLAHVATVHELWAALAGELGVSLSRAEDARARVTAALAERGDAMVVLDAAEHLAAAAWEEVTRLERALPRVAWAVTSIVRPAVHVRVLELGPLPQADAVALLTTRARERDLDARVDPSEPVWAALAERLGGLPLALELAAGRFGVLTPAEILARLDRPRLLAGGRHGSLDGALRYAWDLLGAEERAALAVCSVFRGGFDLPAAEAVLGDDALDRLTALRERSALSWRDGRFYVFDGLRRLAEAEGGDAVREAEVRHRAWYAQRAEALRWAGNGPDAHLAVAALRIERPNFEAAWARARGVAPADEARLAIGLIASARARGPLWAADFLDDPSALARLVGGRVGIVLLATWGSLRRSQGRLEEAAPAAEGAVALAEQHGDAAMLSYTVAELGILYVLRGDRARARACAVRSVEIAPDAEERGTALAQLSVHDHDAGDMPAAVANVEAAIRALREAGCVRAVATSTANLAVYRAMQRRYDEAAALFDESLPVLARLYPPSAVELYLDRVLLSLVRGSRDDAAVILDVVQRLQAEHSLPTHDGLVRYAAGLVRWASGDRAGARACFADAAARLTRTSARTAGTALAFAAAAAAGPNLRADLAAARDAGGLGDLLALFDAWAAGEPLPPPPEWESVDAQAARLLVGGPGPWRVDAEGRWFERPSGRVDLSRRGPMRRIFAALLAARRERPGAGLTVDDLFAAGWPGESALPEAASARVYTAVRELRALGLEPVLLRRAEGYLLDPDFSLSFG